MRCHVCNAEVGENQKFCHECGESLDGVTDPTQSLDMSTVFAQAEADGTDVESALPWSDADAGSAVDVDDSDDGAGAAVVAGTAVASTVSADLATEAVGLTPDQADDLWATPTGEQPQQAPGPIVEPAVDPNATTAMAAQPTELPTDELPTDPIQATESTTAMAPVDPATGFATTDEYGAVPGATGEMPQVFDGGVDVAALPPEPEPIRFRLTLVVGLLSVLTAALASFADVTDVRTDRVVPGIENRLRTLDDIGSNLTIAAFIGAGLMLIGGVLHCFNQRWGAGLAGGAGLALGGWAALTVGLAEVPISTAERITRDPATPGPFILTVTRDLGFWLVIALGALGGIAFLLSLVSAGTGGRSGLNPWTAAVGALGGVIAAAGPLVPIGAATFSSNFGVNDLPLAFFAGRLVQVGVLGLTTMLGFLLVRRYGLGLAAGGLSVPTFLWITSLLDVGVAPVGIGVGNLGTADIAPHAVTTVGVVIALLMLLAAAVMALLDRPR